MMNLHTVRENEKYVFITIKYFVIILQETVSKEYSYVSNFNGNKILPYCTICIAIVDMSPA